MLPVIRWMYCDLWFDPILIRELSFQKGMHVYMSQWSDRGYLFSISVIQPGTAVARLVGLAQPDWRQPK